MSNYSMEVIPKPKEGTAAIFETTEKGEFVFIKGIGSDNYVCGACKSIICENVVRKQIINIVFKCANCGSYNLIKGT